jgi:hypothetical protein
MNEVLMETVITKIEMQEKKILEMQEKFKSQPELTEIISQFKSTIEGLKNMFKGISFSTEEMRELSTNLAVTNALLKKPVKQKVIHHHYTNKALWTAAILFNVVVILGVFLSNARDHINENRESDIKYRHIKLSNDKNLRNILQQTDSLYLADPAQMQKDVIREEERRKEQAELIRQAEEKENEAKQLKEKAKNNLQ